MGLVVELKERKKEYIQIGEDIKVYVARGRGRCFQVFIVAPKDLDIKRVSPEEVEENFNK